MNIFPNWYILEAERNFLFNLISTNINETAVTFFLLILILDLRTSI